MPDICKCSDEKCPSKLKCYRYTAENGICQSYFAESPRKDKAKRCEYFWKVDNKPLTKHK